MSKAKILDGKKIAADLSHQMKAQVDAMDEPPILAVVMVGENEASRIYVRNKQKAAAEIGIICQVYEFSDSIGENALLQSLDELNENHHIHGIIVQQPLPPHLNAQNILRHISPSKDVDGFGLYNSGKLMSGENGGLAAATPKGILRLLEETKEPLSGKLAVVIGRSQIVGRPLAQMLLNMDCTVLIAHSKTKNLKELTKQADIVVAACGQPQMVKGDWVKDGAIVIDVGINRKEDGKLCGDTVFDELSEKVSWITPVPGGVGPMTVAMLLENTIYAALHAEKCCCHCGH